MSTIANTIAVMKVTSLLASRDIAKAKIFGNLIRTKERFPLMITTERIIIEGIYNRVPTYTGLQLAADYGYDLCGSYLFASQAIVDGGGGGSVAPVTPGQTNIYPLVIDGGDFEVDGVTYNNPDIVGDNLMIFVSGFNSEWQFSPAFFSYTATGIVITFGGFNANNYSTIIIQKYTT